MTLNILLSFAQFEREIISERTRDKMSAARRKGKYIGGRPILGYDFDRATKKLVVNELEAERVRQIFDLYLECEGLIGTLEAIQARGWRAKSWVTKTGKQLGGGQFYKTTLHALLTNPIYLGKVSYRDEMYEGEHRAIVDPEVFAAVKKKLNANRVSLGDRIYGKSPGVLAGLLRCSACDSMMTLRPAVAAGVQQAMSLLCLQQSEETRPQDLPKAFAAGGGGRTFCGGTTSYADNRRRPTQRNQPSR